MFYLINQPRTPIFPSGSVKTESDVIVRSMKTGLGRLTLVAAKISVDAYPSWISQTWSTTLRIQE